MSRKPIRIAVIGAGLFVEDTHLPSLLALRDDFTVVAIASRRPESAARLAATMPCPVESTTDVDALLARPEIDAVDIAVPIAATAELVHKALSSGKHVISEKPVAASSQEARSLLALHRTKPGQVWLVAENWRLEPAFRAAAASMRAGAIGAPKIVQWTNYAGLMPDERYYTTTWRRSAENDSGFILDGGVHHVAVLRLVVGEIAEIRAEVALQRADLPPFDTVAATLRFENGAVGTYLTTYAYQAPFPSALHVVGDKGSLSVDTKRLVVHTPAGEAVRNFDSAHHGVQDGFAAFAGAIASGRVTDHDPEEAIRDVLVVEALMESARAATGVAPAKAD